MPQYPNQAIAIENLQRYLRQISYHEPTVPPPPIDGIWESDTADALRAFQSLRSLPETGVADRKTWEALYAYYRASVAAHTPPAAVLFFPTSTPPLLLREGSRGFEVSVLQHMLRELSYTYPFTEQTAPTGIYDAVTAETVRDFQARNRLPASGMTDLATWNAIADQFNALPRNGS